jgi:hypothetical protein
LLDAGCLPSAIEKKSPNCLAQGVPLSKP